MIRCLAFVPVTAALTLAAADAPIDFVREIQPLLAEHCGKCHGPEKQKGGLRLDSKAAAFSGGDSGDPGIVPGHASQSRLFEMVSSKKEDERMPPLKGGGEPLNAQQLDLLRRWIDSGANWHEPEGTDAKPVRLEMQVTEADREHWSFLPLRSVVPPPVSDSTWAYTPVDQFVRQAQEAQGIVPSTPADARTLVRRIFFDLIGVPPTPGEMAHWHSRLMVAGRGKAVAQLVDSLLARPHYGERWARHWLDVARYADSNGQEGDIDRPNAYRFRDFVIRALNDDMSFKQFAAWQLAGDEIAPENPDAVAATGFLVAGNSTLLMVPMEEEKLRNRANELDDMIATTGQGLLGLTLGCARCHDHKYDPVPTRDYYRLMRAFNGGDRTDVPLAPQSEVQAHRSAMASWEQEYTRAVKERDGWVEQARKAKVEKLPLPDDKKRLLKEKPNSAEAKKIAKEFKTELKVETADCVAVLPPGKESLWAEIEERVKTIGARKPAELPAAFAFADFAPEPRETWLFERGDFLARNEQMELGFLTVLMKGKTADDYWNTAKKSKLRDDSTQQRRALSDWMTDLDHGAGTLLARVMVNRVWAHHFGEGLVRTVSDFGTRGELPTHPELLEWLTGEFIGSGWSLKHLHRLIVNSATYQQGTAFDEAKAAIDPENRLLWRRRPLRLQAEALRDSMLAVSGTLNPKMFGPSFKPPISPAAMQARNVKTPYPMDARDTPETRRRTVYMFHKRVVQYPLMQAFDAPDAQVSCGRRMNTTVAPQALALLNDPFVRLRAEELANRLESEAGADTNNLVRRAFQLCLSREPSPEELLDASAFINEQTTARRLRDAQQPPAKMRQLALTDFCQSLFGLNEFIYID